MSITRGNPRTNVRDVRTDERVTSPVDISPVRYAHEQDQDSPPIVKCVRREHTVWTNCPCPPCKADKARMSKRQRAGRWHRVTAEQAWDRIDAMLRDGWTAEAIASASGMYPDTIQAALTEMRLRGRRQRFGATISAQIVNAGQPTAGRVGATGTRRRLQALSAMGHGVAVIGKAAGLSPMAVSTIRAGGTQLVTPRVASGAAAAFAQLAMTPGRSVAARRYAEGRGWLPPLAWDNIDDPGETPAGLPQPRGPRLAGVAAVWDDLRWEDVDRLRSYGVPDDQVAERFGITLDALEKADRRRAAGTPAA